MLPSIPSSVLSRALYLTHIRIRHADVPGLKIICGLQGCKRSFTNFLTYRNHVYANYDNTEEDSRHTSENENSGQNESGNEGEMVGSDVQLHKGQTGIAVDALSP